ncbi:hypothetical protein V6N00_06900 [Tersicoccus sp. MR15.9]|uniref:hypothetical protein n=1 Tax=Tersicoccus mangrovi TaxID=3121635 RepID=UPI002FE55873
MLPLPGAIARSTSFTVAEGRAAGLTDDQMRRLIWCTAGRGLRVQAGHDPALAELAGLLTAVTGAVVSHESAAQLWGFPLAPRPGGLHLLVPLGSARVRRPGVVVHQALVREDEVVVTPVGPLTSRVRTWLDLAQTRSVETMVVVGDHLVRVPRLAWEGREHPYATLDDLERTIRAHPKKRGIVTARAAVPLIRVGADSPPETRLRLRLEDAGLPRFEANRVIRDRDGRRLHQPDLSNETYRVAVEYEGAHHGGEEQMLHDVRRSRRAAEAGWIEVRITAADMLGTGYAAVRAVRQALVARGWRG